MSGFGRGGSAGNSGRSGGRDDDDSSSSGGMGGMLFPQREHSVPQIMLSTRATTPSRQPSGITLSRLVEAADEPGGGGGGASSSSST